MLNLRIDITPRESTNFDFELGHRSFYRFIFVYQNRLSNYKLRLAASENRII
jgi:hypothetical protein